MSQPESRGEEGGHGMPSLRPAYQSSTFTFSGDGAGGVVHPKVCFTKAARTISPPAGRSWKLRRLLIFYGRFKMR